MSLDAILDTIRAGGVAQVEQIEAETQAHVEAILLEACARAKHVREDAAVRSAAPAAKARARILQEARLDALQTVGSVRETLVDDAITQTRKRVAQLRSSADYQAILWHLLDEALTSLQPSLTAGEQPHLRADPRDQLAVEAVLHERGLNLAVSYDLNCLGGLVMSSADERVVVINTFEARLERAIPYLRRALATFFENNQQESV